MSENFENSSLCINKLIPIFSIILENFSINNYDILHLVFQDSIPEYIQLVENMSQTNQMSTVRVRLYSTLLRTPLLLALVHWYHSSKTHFGNI